MTRLYARHRLYRSTTASICRSPSAFVFPTVAVQSSAPVTDSGQFHSPSPVQAAVSYMGTTPAYIEIECPTRCSMFVAFG